MNIGETIKRIREQREISQVALAEKVGVTQAMICQIERGTKNPSVQVAALIAKVLDCTVDELLNNGV